MTELRKKSGLIFDLDGTLADSVSIWFEVDKKFLLRHGVTTTEAYHKQIEHLNYHLAVSFLIEHFSINVTQEYAEAEIMEMIKEEYAENIVLKEGAADYLRAAKASGKKMALATGSLRDCCVGLLQKKNLDGIFDVMLFSGEMKTTKREPFIYLEAAKSLGLTPTECAVFEDMPTGLLAAKSTGMYAVAIVDGLSSSDKEIMENNADEVFYRWEKF